MGYRISFTPSPEDDIRSPPKSIQETVLRQVKTLEMNVRPDGSRIKKLKGVRGSLYRLRIGDYRAVFEVEGNSVTIHRVINRKGLDRVVSRSEK